MSAKATMRYYERLKPIEQMDGARVRIGEGGCPYVTVGRVMVAWSARLGFRCSWPYPSFGAPAEIRHHASASDAIESVRSLNQIKDARACPK